MNVYAEGRISLADQTLFREICAKLKNVTIRPETSCHAVAQAAAIRWPELMARRGLFMNGWEHSWCTTWNGNIIDVYPVAAIGGPLLLDGHDGPWGEAYVEVGEGFQAISRVVLSAIVGQLT